MGVDKLLEICDNMINGNATADEINCAANVLESILTHIKDFIDETNYSPVGYPVEYFNRMLNEALPDYISAAMVPGKLDTISFTDSQKTTDTSKIATATETVLNTAGGAEILNGKSIN